MGHIDPATGRNKRETGKLISGAIASAAAAA
jgi:hypothetical protein